MPKRRMWVYMLMFVLAAINHIGRSAMSVVRRRAGGVAIAHVGMGSVWIVDRLGA